MSVMRQVCAAAVLFAVCASAAWAQQVMVPGQSHDIGELEGQPNTRIARSHDGSTEITELWRNGVYIRQSRTGSVLSETELDQTDHGAVLCIWSFLIEVRRAARLCDEADWVAVRPRLDGAIDRIDGFIAANSLFPTSRTAIDSAVAEADAQWREKAAGHSREELVSECSSGEFTRMVGPFLKQTPVEFFAAIDDLLSVPRPPVGAPCL
jgi:hypothetical protein